MISNQSLDPNRKQKINDFYFFSNIQSDGLHICVTVLHKYAKFKTMVDTRQYSSV